MNILEALILGIVQGLTEFLPVSSSGHLVLFQQILGIEGDYLLFDTMLHMGTLVAVFIALWSEIWALLRRPIQKRTLMLIIATVPAAVIGYLFNDFFESAFGGSVLGFAFIITAVLLVLAELLSALYAKKNNEIGYKSATIMGFMQAAAILPGISRSGSTLVGGLASGTERSSAAKFAFLMSIPIIIGSTAFQWLDVIKGDGVSFEALPMIVGTLAAAASGFFAVKFMLRLIAKHKLYGFSIYTAALGIFVILDQYVLHLVF